MSKPRLLSLGLTALVAIWCIHFATNHMQKFGGIAGHVVPATQQPPALVRALHPSYPYSIIAGGAYTPAELRYAHGTDSVVRAHYSDFNVNRVKLVTLTDDRYEYVSYRLKNQVYWTKRKLRIPKGELLLTDGASYARARCGNRLSDDPHDAQTSPLEPTAKVLSLPPATPEMLPQMALVTPQVSGVLPTEDMPVDSQSGASSPSGAEAFYPPEPGMNGFYPSSPGVALSGIGSRGSTFAPPVTTAAGSPPSPTAPVPPIDTPGHTPLGPPGGTRPPAEVTPVPEPNTLFLFMVALVASSWALFRGTPKSKRD